MSIYYRYHCLDPRCGHVRTTYDRKFNSGMAATLLILYSIAKQRNQFQSWIHIPDHLTNDQTRVILKCREYPRLRLWGFIQPRPSPKGGNKTGLYRLTELGKWIAENPKLLRVPARSSELRHRMDDRRTTVS